jgi:hypothetical protein
MDLNAKLFHCSILKAVCSELPAGMPLFFFPEGYALDVASFVSEGPTPLMPNQEPTTEPARCPFLPQT